MTLYTVVVPTTGRQSLSRTLAALDRSQGPPPEEIVVVDDRSRADPPLQLPELDTAVRILRTGGAGPAAARNAGWRAAKTDWIVFLDDDVVPSPSWREDLLADLDVLPTEVAGCQGSIVVPLPEDRRPTDDERGTAGLAAAWWITADMAFRREALRRAGGFDEAFPRAFREDADLAVRVQNLGYRLVNGRRTTEHPVRPAGFFASVRAQAGNADNALMRAKHGRRWRFRIGEGPGRTEQHFLTTAAALGALAAAARHRNPRWRKTFRGSLGVWALMTAEFTLRRILAGPRTPVEIARMVVTSVLIPPVACWYRLQGELRCRRRKLPAAVLFDRDDTLVHDVPYNSDPARVRAVPGVREALDQLRANEVRIGVVTNQSGVARGLVRDEELVAVNAEVEEQLGPFRTWQICRHAPEDECSCRKPAAGLIQQAAAELEAPTSACVVIGDTGADVEAALAAGAKAILVPTRRTLPQEIEHASQHASVEPTVRKAVRRILDGGL
ncbi:HAD-IIIA family hydrolase [Saccharopolyspora rectivirgula]|jgi:histidinol-phosphate phosphatase family protein|uniref:D,D-heptose 1,7-bisphosphate phosphatase n=1 Tax=Saccharopolyspora rectivirgula TaxID=28042 RepID=A0A073BDG9_9PSEU|nr:HAD-IIIA family hydrolase [Saccharopolyspora rectivirgula]KEI45819.1 HAD family hydrolase [Saccharopolyspora rectivirgula]